MAEIIGKGCGCGCGSIVILLVAFILGVSAVVGVQAAALGDKPLTNPLAAAATGLTWNELVADREAAKKESKSWDSGCDFASGFGLFAGGPAYILYPLAGNDPAGRSGTIGQMIDSRDWDDGFVPQTVPLPEGIFRTYQAYYWNNLVTGASSRFGLGGCKLRPVKTGKIRVSG